MATFAENVLKIATGNVVAQAISFIAVPLITRIYTPEEFGIYSVILSATLILGPIASLRYDFALLLPRGETKALNLLALSAGTCLLSSLLIAAFLLFAPDNILSAMGLSGSLRTLLAIPLGTFLLSFLQNLTFYNIRAQHYRELTLATIAGSLADRGFSLVSGFFFALGPWGLIGGRIFGPLTSVALLQSSGLYRRAWAQRKRVSLKRMWGQALRYKDFPLYSSWAALLNTAAREIPTFLLAAYFTPAVAGLYGLGMRMVNLPMMVVGDAIAKVFFQGVTAEREDTDKLRRISLKLYQQLTFFTLPPTLIFIFAGHELFALFFGDQWRPAGQFLRVLAPSFFVMFLYRPMSVFYDTFNRQRQRLIFDLVNTALRLGTVAWMAGKGFAALPIILAMSLATCAVVGMSLLFLFHIVGLETARIFKVLGRNLLLCLPLIFFLAVGTQRFLENSLQVWTFIVIGSVVQGTVHYFFLRKYRNNN